MKIIFLMTWNRQFIILSFLGLHLECQADEMHSWSLETMYENFPYWNATDDQKVSVKSKNDCSFPKIKMKEIQSINVQFSIAFFIVYCKWVLIHFLSLFLICLTDIFKVPQNSFTIFKYPTINAIKTCSRLQGMFPPLFLGIPFL